MIPRPTRLATVGLFVLFGVCAPARAGGEPKAEATILFSAEGPSPFVLTGTATHVGRFAARGEIEFHPGATDGTLDGVGVAVLAAADGHLIVGVVSCHLDADGAGEVRFSWRDAVEFSDGTVVGNTGRFQRRRPPGADIAFIAILIG